MEINIKRELTNKIAKRVKCWLRCFDMIFIAVEGERGIIGLMIF